MFHLYQLSSFHSSCKFTLILHDITRQLTSKLPMFQYQSTDMKRLGNEL